MPGIVRPLALTLAFGLAATVAAAQESEPVVFVQLGDPQLGRRCEAPGFNPSGNVELCEEVHKRNLIEVFQRAVDIGADFVWVMGDHTAHRSARQKRLYREALALFPQLDVHFVIGNHDVAGGSCGALARYLHNAFDESPPVPRPNWELFEVRGHYFIGLNSNLWGGDMWQHCELLDNVCFRGPTPRAACEIDADCGAGGTCTNWERAAQVQKDFLVEAMDTALADPGLVRVWLAAHHTAWRSAWWLDDDNFFTIHDVERCVGGTHDGLQCTDTSKEGVPYATCAAEGGLCEPDPDRRYRTLLRQQMVRPGCEGRCNYFLSGHNHGNITWQPEGGAFQFHTSAGISAMGGSFEVDPNHPLGAIIWRAWPDGRVERELFNVELQPPFLVGPTAGCATTPDSDGDGVGDGCDNCLQHANPLQVDTDRDGYGNACDADQNQDGTVGITEYALVRAAVGVAAGEPGYDPDLDLDASGAIDGTDVVVASSLFGLPPGPSGLACAGEPGCTLLCLGAGGDQDGDGVADDCDNCSATINPDQRDADFDGYGNACDPDFTNDGVVAISDFGRFRVNFGRTEEDDGYDATCDLDGSRSVDLGDFSTFVEHVFGPPGPSGLGCAGRLPCSRP